MKEKILPTSLGSIHYWTNEFKKDRRTLVFLPGLTANHQLFDKQIEFFEKDFNCLVWDAPGHNLSRPFVLSFSMKDKAYWLKEIFNQEGIEHPVLIGQSMGGYISQYYIDEFPNEISGYVQIDSVTLKRVYMSSLDLYLMKHAEPMYKLFTWKGLKKWGSAGCSETDYGRKLMYEMMDVYTKKDYCKLVGHGYKMLAEAIEENRKYDVTCPAIYICGKKDKAGAALKYNLKQSKRENINLILLENAGHNSNTDKPDEINKLIIDFVKSL